MELNFDERKFLFPDNSKESSVVDYHEQDILK
jgi:hypothetical protein